MSKRRSNLIFRAVVLLFSAAFALLTLLAGIELTEVGDRAAAREKELRALREEEAALRAEYACALSLGELEELALRELGMQRAEPGQIVVIREEG